MRVLVTGGTGFIGGRVCQALSREGHELVVVSRDPDTAWDRLGLSVEAHRWNSLSEAFPPAALAGVRGIVHLAGENLADHRWTKAFKRRIYDSRVKGTRALMDAIQSLPGEKPSALVAASAIGYYGDRGAEELMETSTPGSGFLSELCQAWEKESQRPIPGLRVARVRIGMALGRDGGALKRLLPLFKAGLGGPIGAGQQYMSWVHLDDIVGLMLHVLKNPSLKGVFNATAPNSVTNSDFTKVLARAVHRPAVLPAPAFALKLMLGKMSELVLASQRVKPVAALESGYRFHFPDLDVALEEICNERASAVDSSELSRDSTTTRV